MTAYADQLATALDNAQLYAETRTQQIRLAQIFDSTSDGIVLVNEAERIEAANERAAELAGFDRATALNREIADVLARGDAAPLLAALRSPAGLPDGEAAGDLALGPRILHWVARPTKNASGSFVGFTLSFRDVTEEREISRMKSEFVSFVTHQLRTPLSGIRWMLELAAAEPGLAEDVASYIQDAATSAERLIGLVNDLLNISRLGSSRPTPRSGARSSCTAGTCTRCSSARRRRRRGSWRSRGPARRWTARRWISSTASSSTPSSPGPRTSTSSRSRRSRASATGSMACCARR